MSNALEARLTRLEAKSHQASRKFIVVADEAERDALARAGGIPPGAVVVITGVPQKPRHKTTPRAAPEEA